MTAAPADPCAAEDADVDVRHWRPAGSAALGGATALGLLALGLTAALQTPGRTTAAALGAAVLGAWACVAVLVRPRLTAGPDGLVIRNPLHTVRVPWAALRAIDTGVSLAVHTDARRVTVWAVPAHLGGPRRRTALALRAASGVPGLPPRRSTAIRSRDALDPAPALDPPDYRGRRADGDHGDREMDLVAEQLRTRWHLHHPPTTPSGRGPRTAGPGTDAAATPTAPPTTVRTWPGAAVPPVVLVALLVLLR